MSKLYPPHLEESIVAQSGAILQIPFQLNYATDIDSVESIVARIKTVSTNTWIGTIESDIYYNINDRTYQVEFSDIIDLNLKIGQHYKIQLAFKGLDGIGFFSSVAIFKYTSMPILEIQELDNLYQYMGIYKQTNADQDASEKIYSYKFDLYQNDTLIASSGTLIHNNIKDDAIDESYDLWTINRQTDSLDNYKLYYSITTINGLTATKEYFITNKENLGDALTQYELIANNNFDNGYIDLILYNKNANIENGKYIIMRASSIDNFNTWYKIKELNITNIDSNNINIFQDFTVEQGIYYKYSIQKIDSYSKSQKLITPNAIFCDFEDMFLYDGEKLLKIKYNPRVSSFKTVLSESKINTIGSKFPFVFKNGNINYKEFSIAGLISYLMDDKELFLKQNRENNSTDLDGINIANERLFKIEVLKWLNNGSIKLFRSPTEGNFIIRLMNVSLQPNDTVGRMLHTFNSTAIEMADFTIENLLNLNLL